MKEAKVVKVPTLISAFSAGLGTPFQDGMEYEYVPDSFLDGIKQAYIFTVSGDSMEPAMKAGDKIILDMDQTPQHGDIIALNLNGDLLVKQFYMNNFSRFLKSINKKYKDIKISDNDSLVYIGKVIKVVRDINPQEYL